MRKWGIILISTFLCYVLAGFLLLPALVKHFGNKAIHEQLGDTSGIQKVRANPFTFELRVEGLQLLSTDPEWSVTADRAVANLSAATFFRWHPVFDELKLEQPRVYFRRTKSAEAEAIEEEPFTSEDLQAALSGLEPAMIPEVEVRRLEVSDGHIFFVDAANPVPFEQTMEPINFVLEEFTTVREGEDNRFQFHAVSEGGGVFSIEGNLESARLASKGHIRLENIEVSRFAPYFSSFTHFILEHAKLAVEFDYRLNLADFEHLFSISGGQVLLQDVACRPLDDEERLVQVDEVSVENLAFDYPALALDVGRVRVADSDLLVKRNRDGQVNVIEALNLTPPEKELAHAIIDELKPPPDQGVQPVVRVSEVDVSNFSIRLLDQYGTVEASAVMLVEHLSLTGVGSDLTVPVELQMAGRIQDSGTLEVKGSFAPDLSVAAIDVRLETMPLALGDAYARNYADGSITSGQLFFDGALSISAESGRKVTGDARVAGFAASVGEGSQLDAAFESLNLDGIKLLADPLSLTVEKIQLIQPHAEVVQAAQTGLPESTEPQAGETALKPGPSANMDVAIQVGAFEMSDGSMKLVDESIEPATTLMVEKMEATIENIAYPSSVASELKFNAEMNQTPVEMSGVLYPIEPYRATDLNFKMSGLPLPGFSPYSGKFVGRRISKGWFSLEGDWKITDSKLKAGNHILLDQFELGESVESEDAIRLPMDLAISLLKGPSGKIDVKLPLSGDLSDPKAGLGNIILSACISLITKTATAPFSLLSGLVGSEEDLSQVEFAAGSSKLDDALVDQLNALAEAMEKRPELALSLIPSYSEADLDALKLDRLRAQIMADESTQSEAVFHKKLMRAYRDLMRSREEPVVEYSIDNPEDVQAVEDILAQTVELPEGALDSLALERVRLVEEQLIASQNLDASRVSVQAIRDDSNFSGVRFELK
ncbi:DUF748 domain-containing protein [Coraliomargarita parva]|uniref:DUF748 domain-containing protein n=1 Tax=Coraliomargarita parva TaxID=3014050 RepID=UPI0022B3CFD6|nr:DUF748 domain-containing protein [Coraliomargarita parva]